MIAKIRSVISLKFKRAAYALRLTSPIISILDCFLIIVSPVS